MKITSKVSDLESEVLVFPIFFLLLNILLLVLDLVVNMDVIVSYNF